MRQSMKKVKRSEQQYQSALVHVGGKDLSPLAHYFIISLPFFRGESELFQENLCVAIISRLAAEGQYTSG